ncbi:hypothetical protein LSH36_480g00023 [Paralvinella palmiformis]|uniref:Uncharacterized protein n=1 Tax=Paralvinella palmiformis TaxID=53620 RepID=A0AAD9JAE2_9ANNE|nr:hypothetical protein LSH36_480g00023 [Paralvinella palmiformis]
MFVIQPNTWPTEPAYVTTEAPFVILYTSGIRWHFTENYATDDYLAYVDDNAHAPQLIGNVWRANISGSWVEARDLSISCETHQQEEFIQNCLWKGKPCEDGSIKKKLTDMGLLMHEADDVPMMSERGTAVSPGLYSFISVETTTVRDNRQ